MSPTPTVQSLVASVGVRDPERLTPAAAPACGSDAAASAPNEPLPARRHSHSCKLLTSEQPLTERGAPKAGFLSDGPGRKSERSRCSARKAEAPEAAAVEVAPAAAAVEMLAAAELRRSVADALDHAVAAAEAMAADGTSAVTV